MATTRQTRHAALGLDPERLLAMYAQMLAARAVDRRLWVLSRRRGVPAASSAGREAVQVGAAAALRRGHDWLLPDAGAVPFWIAMGVEPAEALRAASDADAGAQGFAAARIVSTSSLVATHVVHAAGIAYASRARGLDEVTLVAIGRAGTGKGDWHEGLNFAGVHRLPLVCLVEDADGPVGGLPRLQAGGDLVARRAEGYGMAAGLVDGGDVLAVFGAVRTAVDRARAGDGPALVVARVPRLASRGEDGFHAQEELEALLRHDPLERFRAHLAEEGLLTDDADERMQQEAMRAIAG